MINNLVFEENLDKKLKNIKFAIGFPDWYKYKTAVVSAFHGVFIGCK